MHDWSSACPPAAHPRPPLAPTAPRAQGSAAAPVDAFAWGSVVVGGPLDIGSEFERRLAAGAGIACRLRGAIARELGARSMGACTLPSSLPAHTPARLPAAAAAAAVQPGAASHLSPPHPTLTPPPPLLALHTHTELTSSAGIAANKLLAKARVGVGGCGGQAALHTELAPPLARTLTAAPSAPPRRAPTDPSPPPTPFGPCRLAARCTSLTSRRLSPPAPPLGC